MTIEIPDYLSITAGDLGRNTPAKVRVVGDADDVAWAAVYLASDESKFLTGQVLSPNGGWTMNQ